MSKPKRMYQVQFEQTNPGGQVLKPYTCSAPSAQNAVRKAIRHFAKKYNNTWKPSFNNAVVSIL